MPGYLLYFNQQWVGDHSEVWFRERGSLAGAVVDEMRAAGVYVVAGGMEEGVVCTATPDGEVAKGRGSSGAADEVLGGFAVVEVADDAAAAAWAGKLAQACGWPHAVRRFT